MIIKNIEGQKIIINLKNLSSEISVFANYKKVIVNFLEVKKKLEIKKLSELDKLFEIVKLKALSFFFAEMSEENFYASFLKIYGVDIFRIDLQKKYLLFCDYYNFDLGGINNLQITLLNSIDCNLKNIFSKRKQKSIIEQLQNFEKSRIEKLK